MADKIYVKVGNMNVKEAYDNKYKSSLPKVMKAAAEKALKTSSKLTLTEPSADGAKGFRVDATLTLKKTSSGVTAEVNVALINWPENTLYGNASSKATLSGTDPGDDDVEDLVSQVMDGVLKKQIIKEFEKGVD